VLERFGLRERFQKDPAGTLALLHSQLAPRGDQRKLSALAELSFYHGDRSGDAAYYFASAVYAYALLFPGARDELLDPSDPRVRLAYDLYNRGIARALSRGKKAEVQIATGVYQLPFGSVELEMADGEFLWAGHRLQNFVSAADLAVHGLRNRYRRTGLGAPLSAEIGPHEGRAPPERFLPGLRVPATLIFRFDDPRQALVSGKVRGVGEIATPSERTYVYIDGRRVPIEFETTSAMAATLAKSPLWDFELRGFFSGTFRPLAKAVENAVVGQPVLESETDDEGLLFLQPYVPGRIPLVLVHGTASSPARWANMVNDLSNERVIRERYQIWLFLYNTGNPIGYSGGLLRRALENAVGRFDPDGTDPAIRQMVVIGHSQGGLLAKLTAVDAGTRFWDSIARVPLEQLDLSDDVRETLRISTQFTPQPFVRRVVFLCTPQRGSYLASFRIARLLNDFLALPSNLTQVVGELVVQNQEKLLLRSVARLPTSIDNMTPGNPFIKILADLPVAPEIRTHSIIAVRGDGPPDGQSDGVVAYKSAHIDGVDSELVVRSGHSAQDLPATIEEIRRILLLHAMDGDDSIVSYE
jgi:pimeloyl-ACP methyl ester carboxylesterase